MKFSVKTVLVLVLFFSFPVEIGNCESQQETMSTKIVDDLKAAMVYAYYEGFVKHSCENVEMKSELATLETYTKNPNISPEDVALIKSIIKILGDCCTLGRIDRLSGEDNLPGLLADVDAIAGTHKNKKKEEQKRKENI